MVHYREVCDGSGGVGTHQDLYYVQVRIKKKKIAASSSLLRVWSSTSSRRNDYLAFQRDSPLAVDLSTAILTLSENGDLQRIHDKWLTSASGCTSEDTVSYSNQLSLGSFWGLFLICGATCVIALAVFFMRICWQYTKYGSMEAESSHSRTSDRCLGILTCFRGLMSFVDKREEDVKSSIKKLCERSQQTEQSSDGPTLSSA